MELKVECCIRSKNTAKPSVKLKPGSSPMIHLHENIYLATVKKEYIIFGYYKILKELYGIVDTAG